MFDNEHFGWTISIYFLLPLIILLIFWQILHIKVRKMSSNLTSEMQHINGVSESRDIDSNQAKTKNCEDVVTPWTVSATSSKGIDYDKLIGILKVKIIIFHS